MKNVKFLKLNKNIKNWKNLKKKRIFLTINYKNWKLLINSIFKWFKILSIFVKNLIKKIFNFW